MFFWEEPIHDAEQAHVELRQNNRQLYVAVPHLPASLTLSETCEVQKVLLSKLLSEHRICNPVVWYYTPMAWDFTEHLRSSAVVYDCMDELSAFRGAPLGLRAAEQQLFSIADLVFTGGQSLYERKRRAHPSVHCFPSSIDREFFSTARLIGEDPSDQQPIRRPRLGYCGVIDERMDLGLLAAVAQARPEWQIVMVGPVVKISESDLPKADNLHYLGMRGYRSLPSYLSGWEVGLLPFAHNDSTRFISPTKTPEYLAAGLPVVSTSIRDVVTPYGIQRLVEIADTPQEFVAAAERAMGERNSSARLKQVDQFLSNMSWDSTWTRMSSLIMQTVARNADGAAAEIESPGVLDSFAAD